MTRGYALGPECACRELGTGARSPGTECVAPAPALYNQEVQFSPVHIEPPHLSRPLQVHGTQRRMCPCHGRALWYSYAQRARPVQVYRHGAPDWRGSSGSGKGSGRSGDSGAPWEVAVPLAPTGLAARKLPPPPCFYSCQLRLPADKMKD